MLTEAGRVKLDVGIKQYIREQMRREFAKDFSLVEQEMDHLIAHYSLSDLRSKIKERIKMIKQEFPGQF